MAEDLTSSVDIADIVNPSASSNNAELAWHFMLPAYTSGYMYYGSSLDMEVKQTLACNNATSYADIVINANSGTDNTAPTVFIPQRFPYNPGGTGYGPIYDYQQHQNSSDFHVWTFAYDVSGIQIIELKYRVDFDGQNPLSNNENETYAGGSDVSSWSTISMSERVFPTGNITGSSEIDFFILPNYIAKEYYAEISGFSDTLIDYYVEATDLDGNITKSPIQHVYVGSYSGGSSQTGVYWEPSNPDLNDSITIFVSDASIGAKLHWGIYQANGDWDSPISEYYTLNSDLFNGSGPALESPFSGPDANNLLSITIGPFDNPMQIAEQIAFVIHYDNDTWDNNNSNDYYISIDNNPSTKNEVNSFNSDIEIFPNPFSDFCYIVTPENKYSLIEVFNNSGELVKKQKIEQRNVKFERGNLNAGIYFVRVSTENQSLFSMKKLIIL